MGQWCRRATQGQRTGRSGHCFHGRPTGDRVRVHHLPQTLIPTHARCTRRVLWRSMCRRNPDRSRSDEPVSEPMAEPGADRPRASAGCRCSCDKFWVPPPDGRRRVGVMGRRGWEGPRRQPPVGELGPDPRSYLTPRTAKIRKIPERTHPHRAKTRSWIRVCLAPT